MYKDRHRKDKKTRSEEIESVGVKGDGRREGRGEEVFSLDGKIIEPDGKTRGSETVGTSIVN